MNESNNKIRFASEAVVDSIILKSYNGDELDITALAEAFNIYEDIFENTLCGDVIIVDALSILSSFPIIGREILEITFRSKIDSESVKCVFETYRLSDINRSEQDNKQMFVLYFVSPEVMINKKIKISKAYENKHSKIVKNIFDNFLKNQDNDKDFNILETDDNERIVFPYWNPLRCINYIASKARYKDDVSYVFFETLKSFNFLPLSYLAQRPIRHQYTRSFVNQVDPETKNRDIITPFITTEDISIKSPFNQIDKMSKGTYSGSVLSYDPLYRDYQVNTYSYYKDFNNVPRLNENKILPNNETLSTNFQTCVNYVPTHNNRNTDIQSDFVKESFLKRTAQLNQFDNIVIITVPGTTDLKVGNIVYLDVPATKAPRGTERESDRIYSGKYMIRTIRHSVIRNQEYKCIISLMRDSLASPLPDKKSKTEIKDQPFNSF